MPDTKKQHYVPQFYLKRFADNNGAIYAFNKFTKKSFRTRIQDIASEMRYYDLDAEIHHQFRDKYADIPANHPEAELIRKALDPQMIEHELRDREAKYAPIFNGALDAIHNRKRLTNRQRWYMSEFIALQILRTPEARRINIDLQKGLLEELLKRTSDNAMDEYFVEFNESFASLEHAHMMFNPDMQAGLGQAIADHIWLYGINTTSQQFYISDTPVVKRSHVKSRDIGEGFGSYGIEVAFPLTPQYMLIMCERTAFSFLSYLDESFIDLTTDHVVYYNAMQILQSYRSIYCPKGEFLLAADLSNAFPEFSKPERLRVQVG